MMTWVTLTIFYYLCFHIRCWQTAKYFIMYDHTPIHCNVCIYKPSPLEGNINPTLETLWILMKFSYRWSWMALMVKQLTINKLMAEQLAETKCHLCNIFFRLSGCEWRIRTNTVKSVKITFLPQRQTTTCSIIFIIIAASSFTAASFFLAEITSVFLSPLGWTCERCRPLLPSSARLAPGSRKAPRTGRESWSTSPRTERESRISHGVAMDTLFRRPHAHGRDQTATMHTHRHVNKSPNCFVFAWHRKLWNLTKCGEELFEVWRDESKILPTAFQGINSALTVIIGSLSLKNHVKPWRSVYFPIEHVGWMFLCGIWLTLWIQITGCCCSCCQTEHFPSAL